MDSLIASVNTRPVVCYGFLGTSLFLATFGLEGVSVIVIGVFCFLLGILLVLLQHGWVRSEELIKEFESVDSRFSTGFPQLCKPVPKPKKVPHSDKLTGSPLIDPILEEIISYTLRDFVESWYCMLSNDEQLKEQLKSSANRTVQVLSESLRKVDWIPFLTREIVDDFASHVRLYRKAKELARSKADNKEQSANGDENIESEFFDLELEMEGKYCRDLVSTSAQYENAYLHDLVDILLYLVIPPEDFRCRPFRFLLREIVVKKIFLPVLDQFSDPDYINYIIIWMLSDIPLNADDFISVLEVSESVDELTAIRDCVDDEIAALRAKDTAGADEATLVKQQLNSLFFVRRLAIAQTKRLSNGEDVGDHLLEENQLRGQAASKLDLPLAFVLTNSISLSYFIDFLCSVGGQAYIDLFLAIEGFKVSVEHQLSKAHLRRVTDNQKIDPEIYHTIREAAQSLYRQYLSEEALEKVRLDDHLLVNLINRITNGQPSENWFDDVQTKLMDTLEKDARFYPAFKRSHLYFKMLADLALIDRDGRLIDDATVASGCDTGLDVVSAPFGGTMSPSRSFVGASSAMVGDADGEPILSAHITTTGIGREANAAFALYNINVTRANTGGETLSSWNVMRRYSDFHTLHSIIEQRLPNLASLSFPGKRTFNNLNHDFLDKRKNALNSYLSSLLYPEILKKNAGLENVVMDFLCQKDYVGERGLLTKKMMASFVNPIRSGVKAMGSAVTSVPENVYGSVVRVGDGIGKVTKSVLGVPDVSASLLVPSPFEGRVGAELDEGDLADNIPMRVMLLFMDELFGLRARNQWFRRRMVAFLRQLLSATLGSSINRKIVDFVVWLTSEEQVAEYLKTFKTTFWPNGQLSDPTPERPHNVQMRTRIVAKAKMLAALPDELRLFVGNETSRGGVQALFNTLQSAPLNRRLLYVLLERLLVTVFPAAHFERILPRLHAKSPRCQPQQQQEREEDNKRERDRGLMTTPERQRQKPAQKSSALAQTKVTPMFVVGPVKEG